ncbi:MAG: gliding motility-associated C-terminal domain-containing protein [Bacteroidales bacterium]|nr:gliding motility-associated C-terminal domain-containing protein [Bacteroidales bacterium]
MHKYIKLLAISIVLLQFGYIPCYAQIQSSTPYYDSTNYTEGPQDKIFIFYKQNEAADNNIGDLSVSDPNGCDTCDFTWYSFDNSLHAFSATSFATGASISSLSGGGYKVVITNHAGYDTSFVAWIFISYLNVSVEKDAEGKVTEGSGNCDCLDLSGSASYPIRFTYYDLKNDKSLQLLNTITLLWTHDGESDADLTDADELRPSVCIPPYFDVTYTMNVYDKYKFSSLPATDEVLYESEIPHAVFGDVLVKGSHITDEPSSYDSPPNENGFSAPAFATFSNESENADAYTWILIDTIDFAYDPNYLVKTKSLDTIIEYTYYIPTDSCIVKLVAHKEECTDTASITIKIAPSELEVPTLVSPDQGYYFMLKNESIKSVRVRIFDRWGKKIYEYDGDINTWNGGKGWDGTVKESSREAPTGMYFYVIEARGWDNIPWKFPNDNKEEVQDNTGQTQNNNGSSGSGNTTNTTNLAKGYFYLFRSKGL